MNIQLSNGQVDSIVMQELRWLVSFDPNMEHPEDVADWQLIKKAAVTLLEYYYGDATQRKLAGDRDDG